MHRLLYRSQVADGVKAADVFDIVAQSERNNPKHAMTGFLLQEFDSFLQFLEGPVFAVEALLTRIEEDPRHSNLEVLYREDAQTRLFDEWSMKHLLIFGERPGLEQLRNILCTRPDGERLLSEVEKFVSGG